MKTKWTSIIITSQGTKVNVLNNEYICLTLQWWPWCSTQAFNSSHAAGLRALYSHECV